MRRTYSSTSLQQLRLIRSLLLSLACAVLPATAQAAGMVLVALNPQTPEITLKREDVADLFLGRRKLYAGGISLVPLDTKDETLRESFYQGVAGMSSNRVRAHWARLVFSSQGRPPREVDAETALASLLNDRGILIYTFANRVPPGAKIMLKLD